MRMRPFFGRSEQNHLVNENEEGKVQLSLTSPFERLLAKLFCLCRNRLCGRYVRASWVSFASSPLNRMVVLCGG